MARLTEFNTEQCKRGRILKLNTAEALLTNGMSPVVRNSSQNDLAGSHVSVRSNRLLSTMDFFKRRSCSFADSVVAVGEAVLN